MQKINVLHIIQNSKTGGVQKQLLNLLKTYDLSIINPIVCSFRPKEEIGIEIEKLGLDFISFDSKRHYRFSPQIIMKLIKLMKQKKIHVVRAHKYRASLYGRIAARFAGIPVVITSVHGNYRKDLRLERRIANKILLRGTDRIVAVSESIKKDIVKYDKVDPSKVVVVYNGTDLARFSPDIKAENMRKSLSIKEDDIVVCCVGRIVPAKGLEYLIEAVSLLKKEIKNIKLLLVGGGWLLEKMKKKASECGVDDLTIFTGKRDDVPEILSCIDVFVMPSIAEGFGNAIVEAMSMEKPVVGTRIGGIPEIIKDGVNGIIVPPEDPQALAKAIKDVIVNKPSTLKMLKQAKEDALSKFTIQGTARKWESLYRSLLEEKGYKTA